MNLHIKRGDTPVTQTYQAHKHHEADFDIEMNDRGYLTVRSRGGAAFITVDPFAKEYVIDVLNFPHVDVGKRKAEQEKKATKESKK